MPPLLHPHDNPIFSANPLRGTQAPAPCLHHIRLTLTVPQVYPDATLGDDDFFAALGTTSFMAADFPPVSEPLRDVEGFSNSADRA